MAYEEFKLGHAKASIYHADNGSMELHSLRVPNKYRKTGEAHKMMQHLTSIADEKGKKMKLISSPLDKKTHATKLYNFYRKHGFEHTGALIGGMPVMERKPKSTVTSSDLAHIPLFAYLYEDANEDTTNPRYSLMQTPGMTSKGAFVDRNPNNQMQDHDDDLTKINFEEDKQYLRDHNAPLNDFEPAEMPYDNSMPSNIKEGDYSPGFNFKSPSKWHAETNTPVSASNKKKVKLNATLTPTDIKYMLDSESKYLREIAKYYVDHPEKNKVESKYKVTKKDLDQMLKSDDKDIREVAKAYIKNLKAKG